MREDDPPLPAVLPLPPPSPATRGRRSTTLLVRRLAAPAALSLTALLVGSQGGTATAPALR